MKLSFGTQYKNNKLQNIKLFNILISILYVLSRFKTDSDKTEDL